MYIGNYFKVRIFKIQNLSISTKKSIYASYIFSYHTVYYQRRQQKSYMLPTYFHITLFISKEDSKSIVLCGWAINPSHKSLHSIPFKLQITPNRTVFNFDVFTFIKPPHAYVPIKTAYLEILSMFLHSRNSSKISKICISSLR